MAQRRLKALNVALGFLLGCTGTITDAYTHQEFGSAQDEPDSDSSENTVGNNGADVPGDGGFAPGNGGTSGAGGGSTFPGGSDDVGGGSDGLGGDDGPQEADPAPGQFLFATVGSRCHGGSRQRFVVVSREAGSCESHARALDEQSANDVLKVALGESGSFSGAVSLCTGDGCSDVNVNVALSGDESQADLEAALAEGNIQRSLAVERCDYDALVPPSRDALATDISIREVALYQGVKVALAKNGEDVATRNAPVVEGRPGLLRVFVEPGATFSARDIVARLVLDHGTGEPETLETTLRVSGASSDSAMNTTLNFDLSGAQIKESTRYSVSLHEADVCGGEVSEASNARFPIAGGLSELAAESTGGPFRLVLVPVRYNADGSGRLPDLSESVVNSYREFLYSMFPVSEIEVSVRAPMNYNAGVTASGDGWSALLDACLTQRQADQVDPKTYYYCIFNPASSFRNYCGNGCVSGLGPVPSPTDRRSRGSIGLGFTDGGNSANTMAHEIGHSLGRPHAPCGGPSNPDSRYPYAGGSIGAWGYDMRTKELLAPDGHTDIMGYCRTKWISDYNYDLFFTRFQTVFTQPLIVGNPLSLTSIIVNPNGSLSLGHTTTTREIPTGDSVRVRYLSADGSELGRESGWYTAVTHVAGGIAYVPTPPAGTKRVSIEGIGILEL